MIDYKKYITVEPRSLSENRPTYCGKPCIQGLIITVYDVLNMLAGCISHEDIMEDFPKLTKDDILACLAFSGDGVNGQSQKNFAC